MDNRTPFVPEKDDLALITYLLAAIIESNGALYFSNESLKEAKFSIGDRIVVGRNEEGGILKIEKTDAV